MPMREECVHFQSRMYANGETARYCTLDLAPEAPWKCPDDCPKYARLSVATDFEHGSLARPVVPPRPEADPDAVAAVLDEAEDIVNAVGPQVLAELAAEREPWWRRLSRRFGGGGDGPGRGGRRPGLSNR